MADIYIKDEGEHFSTVIFDTDQAQKMALENIAGDWHGKKIDVPNDQLYKILGWAISHNLTVESEVSIIIPSKN